MSNWEIIINNDEAKAAEDYLINNNPKLAAINGAGRSIAIIIISLALITILFEIFRLNNLLEDIFTFLAIPLLLFRILALIPSLFDKNIEIDEDINISNLPIYSILIAVYKESEIIPYLINSVEDLDWDKNKLDIIFLCEEDDIETISTIKSLKRDLKYRLIILPKGRLKTKPRALQIGLKYIYGEFATIYDAEDRPHHNQLKEAYNKFQQKGNRLAVVQAPLVTWNNRENWISAQFALDYAIWFRIIIPFLAKYFKTFPLGGTSNHFRVEILRQIGGWDPQNLTEDADLGARLAINGYDADYINLPTYEESPPRINSWIRQRTRWVQGHMQTVSVLSRNLETAIANKSIIKFIAIFIGIINGPIYGALRIQAFILILFNFNSLNYMLLFIITEFILAIQAIIKDGRMILLRQIFSMPLYWILQTFAIFRASYRIFTIPYVWEKTDHGTCARK